MKKRGFLFVIVLGVALVVVFLYRFEPKNSNPNQQSDSQLRVVTSFYPLYFFAEWIGGDLTHITNIIPVGIEPHDYELTGQDMATIEKSKLVILNGGRLESWGEKIKQNIDLHKTLIITVGEGLATQYFVEDEKNRIDPHVWLAPALAKQMVNKIAIGFAEANPTNAGYYAARAATLDLALDSLDQEYQQGLANCVRRDFITSHNAFGYLAAAYNLNQIPIAGLSPETEPSPRQLAEVARLAKQTGAKIIFFESLASPKLSQAIASEIGAQIMVLNPIEGLTESEIVAGRNYLTEMRQNLINLKIALQCTP